VESVQIICIGFTDWSKSDLNVVRLKDRLLGYIDVKCMVCYIKYFLMLYSDLIRSNRL